MTSIIDLMYNFQNLNNIKGQCITNAKYLYDNFNNNLPQLQARATPVICISGIKTIIHMVVMINDTIYDPSYELFSLKDVKYFNNIKQYLDNITPESRIKLGPSVIRDFIDFTELAKNINEKKIVIDTDYYQEQADYVEKYFKT
jgi:hypothetical protein